MGSRSSDVERIGRGVSMTTGREDAAVEWGRRYKPEILLV